MPTSRVCPGTEGKKCSWFQPNIFKDYHPTCTIYCQNDCYRTNTCSICTSWDEGHWTVFNNCHHVIFIERERERKKKAKAKSSTSLFSGLEAPPVAAFSRDLGSFASGVSTEYFFQPPLCTTRSVCFFSTEQAGWEGSAELLESLCLIPFTVRYGRLVVLMALLTLQFCWDI